MDLVISHHVVLCCQLVCYSLQSYFRLSSWISLWSFFPDKMFLFLYQTPQAPIPRQLNVKVCLSALRLCRLLLYSTHSYALCNIFPFVTHFALLWPSSLPIIVCRPFLNVNTFVRWQKDKYKCTQAGISSAMRHVCQTQTNRTEADLLVWAWHIFSSPSLSLCALLYVFLGV